MEKEGNGGDDQQPNVEGNPEQQQQQPQEGNVAEEQQQQQQEEGRNRNTNERGRGRGTGTGTGRGRELVGSCPMCKMDFYTYVGYTQHMERMHPDIRIFCFYCQMSFPNAGERDEHMSIVHSYNHYY